MGADQPAAGERNGLENTARRRWRALPIVTWRLMRHVPRLSRRDRREYLLVVALAMLSEPAVRWLRLGRAARLFGVALDEHASAILRDEVIELPSWAIHRLRVVTAVMRRWPVDGTCLRHSLVAGHRLRALGPRLCIGVARGDRGVTAHAWLEVWGRSLDPSAQQYTPLELTPRP